MPATLPEAGLIALVLLFSSARAAILRDIRGVQQSEVLFASSGGGTHVYLSGTDIGSAFAPPIVVLGERGQVDCKVQPFTSARNRLHCIISAAHAPAPLTEYNADGAFVSLPLHLYHRSKRAKCWHEAALGDSCTVRFDVGATPRVLRVLTPLVEPNGMLRLSGEGIDGGLTGAQRLAATLYRGAVPALS